LFCRLDGISASARLDRVSHVLEQVGLSAQSDVDVAGYSAGMRQRLGLAAALLRAPQLLLLDEPTSSLDPAGAREVRVLARRLVQQGVAVLLSSHDMSEVEQLCDALTIIDGGRVIFSGTADQLRKLAGDAVHALRTSNDDAAIDLSSGRSGIRVVRDTEGIGLVASADIEALDAYVVALGHAGIAVRALEHRGDSLEALFLRLTGQHGGANEPVWREGSGGPRASRAAS
jgi:ABC-2 type transport system ATP-binding protein